MTRLAVLLVLAGCDKLLSLDDIKPPIDAPPGPIQQISSSQILTTMLSATLTSPPTSGNVLVMIGATPARSLTSVTGGGVMWQRATVSVLNNNLEIWWGITDGSSSTVTIDCSGCSTRDMRMLVAEWGGISMTNPLDIASQGFSGDTTMPATASLTTRHASDLLIFAVSDVGTLSDPGLPWLALDTIAFGATTQQEWYQLVGDVGTYSPQVTPTSLWDAGMIALQLVR